jgi:6-phosphogluconate dehydrogenase
VAQWVILHGKNGHIEQGVPAPVMSLALIMRFASQGKGDYADRLLSMMRKSFGGHAVQGSTERAK